MLDKGACFSKKMHDARPRRFTVRSTDRKSLTLLEIILVVLILSIGVVMILKSFFSASQGIEYSNNRLAAIQFIDAKMAQLRLDSLSGVTTPEGQTQSVVDLRGRDFSWQCQITPLFENDRRMSFIKAVQITVEWKEGNVLKRQELSGFIDE